VCSAKLGKNCSKSLTQLNLSVKSRLLRICLCLRFLLITFRLLDVGDNATDDMQNCCSVTETISKVMTVLRTIDLTKTLVTVKIGRACLFFEKY
jgi:hypothetical protein